VTGYSVSELLAPNTPVAAEASACAGTPVYGAAFFAKTQVNGVNARSGPGVEYPQVKRYRGNCTLGFDGYCIGRAVPDFVLHTPDQRWLIVHDESDLVASAVVLSESACLADNVPVVSSLRVQLLTFHGAHITKEQPNPQIPKSVRPLLAEVACNSSGL
jgi:hypothetical protein